MASTSPRPPVEVIVLPAVGAKDDALVAEIAALINRVYAAAEAGLWIEGATRTDVRDVASLVGAGEIAVARLNERLVGTVRIHQLDGSRAEFGMLAVVPDERGHGIGRELVGFAERWAGERNLTRMQLELLVPRAGTHQDKEFLKIWYDQMGYRAAGTGRLDEAYPSLVALLATPCDLVIYGKDLPAR
jgi:GNAT superfamily N-acetyltransferase